MAKKSRRARRQQTTKTHHNSSPAVVQPSPTRAAPAPSARSGAAPASPPSRTQVDFRTEYHYVVNDLRTMAIIAVGMLVVLLALSFVIR
jgi:hypothetical protein